MQHIYDIARDIIAREGGYVNDADDPGGATKYGVTLATLKRYGHDKTGDGRIDHHDLKLLEKRDALRIFVDHYYKAPRIDLLPAEIQDSVFDMSVNAGRNAVRILQRVLVQMGYALKVDGRIGPKTTRACRAAADVNVSALRDAYGIARRNYYFAIGDRRPSSRKYVRSRTGRKGGWIKRSEEFISKRYHLSTAEFNARVAPWG
ncbi:peptidoglycan-binding protein [Epibacterium sp. SM1969]|uniref:Peptidoglycan-binding protein n=1 Tax=Tritonibacter aquimaris TaxID=2663379 RepID=A0A844AKE7_9RHOB|nr:holin-associated N-acetylmuramidase [Tritonibacter aquimaris]MQY41569.1 peptidoglycan-binding protein [Tritonibacter aquimaris]